MFEEMWRTISYLSICISTNTLCFSWSFSRTENEGMQIPGKLRMLSIKQIFQGFQHQKHKIRPHSSKSRFFGFERTTVCLLNRFSKSKQKDEIVLRYENVWCVFFFSLEHAKLTIFAWLYLPPCTNNMIMHYFFL